MPNRNALAINSPRTIAFPTKEEILNQLNASVMPSMANISSAYWKKDAFEKISATFQNNTLYTRGILPKVKELISEDWLEKRVVKSEAELNNVLLDVCEALKQCSKNIPKARL